MKILQTIKYFEPSKGGMESVAKNLVLGVKIISPKNKITVLCNNHKDSKNNVIEKLLDLTIVRYKSFFYKSQPISFLFKGLKKYILGSDIIHHHYPFPTMELALLKNVNVLKRKNFIITWHANIQNSRWSWIERFYNPVIDKLLDSAKKIVVTSPQLFEYSSILQKYKDKIEVIPLSFESHNEDVYPKKLSETPQILFVGKLRIYKGLKFLIEAVKDLNVVVNIVGNGELQYELNEIIHKYKLQHKVFLHTNVNDNDLKIFYQKSDLFVLPSINEAEAFGVVQLEALSYGLPVINTKLKSGVPFVSLDNLTGYTVDPSNSTELRNAILKVISDPNNYSVLSKNAINRSKEFSNEKMVEKYMKVYEN